MVFLRFQQKFVSILRFCNTLFNVYSFMRLSCVLHRIQDKINLIKSKLYSILFINIRKVAHGNKPRKYNHIKNMNFIKGNHTPTTSWKGDFQK